MQYAFIKENAARGHKQMAVLIDPESEKIHQLDSLLYAIHEYKVELIFLGGSFLMKDELDFCIQQIRKNCPAARIILFPGSQFQIHKDADAILFLSLLSGRRAEYLIGKQVIAAPYIKNIQLETIGTAYILIDGGPSTAAHYMSGSAPIPYSQNNIAASTAIAGQMLGMQAVYLDAGSGAERAVSPEMIHHVRKNIEVPMIVGGGIRTPEDALQTSKAGADIIVIGNVIEKDPSLIPEFQMVIREQQNLNTP